MKLRIYGNSVRLRLSRTDMQMFIEKGRIQDVVQFASDSRLSYSLESTPSLEEVQARYQDGVIRVLIPAKIARQWISSDQVGISFAGSIGPSLLIEKDFRCLHRELGEENDDVDAFPNPLDCSEQELAAEPPTPGQNANRQSASTIRASLPHNAINDDD
jgi:hypothetical protein